MWREATLLLTLLLVVAVIAAVVGLIRGEGPATTVAALLIALVLIAGRF